MNTAEQAPSRDAALAQWLSYIERLHPRSIAMGLERVASVRRALALDPAFPIFTVGGTNGKGSACAMLEAILHHAGYRTGCYTSPHLERYNERVRISRREASDEALVGALSAVESARGTTTLTYFEFSTLAAVWLFQRDRVDVAVLEVGLGGRLDAVNVFDCDCALLTSVDLDHIDYLGDTREAIGAEKAGIFRPATPAICGEPQPPATVAAHAARIGADLLVIGRDFGYEARPGQWRYWGPHGARPGLPHPALRGRHQIANAAAAIAALDALRERLPVTAADIRTGLLTAENPARFQVIPGRPIVILDVAHNPAAARALAENLASMKIAGRTYAVFSMLNDKDIEGVVAATKRYVDEWFVAATEGSRGAGADIIRDVLVRAGHGERVHMNDRIASAYAQACDRAAENDRIVVFGSFYTVAAVMAARQALRAK